MNYTNFFSVCFAIVLLHFNNNGLFIDPNKYVHLVGLHTLSELVRDSIWIAELTSTMQLCNGCVVVNKRNLFSWIVFSFRSFCSFCCPHCSNENEINYPIERRKSEIAEKKIFQQWLVFKTTRTPTALEKKTSSRIRRVWEVAVKTTKKMKLKAYAILFCLNCIQINA